MEVSHERALRDLCTHLAIVFDIRDTCLGGQVDSRTRSSPPLSTDSQSYSIET